MPVGRLLIAAGVVLVLIGLVSLYAPWLLNWFGRLPGDLRFESGRSKLFIPITSMLLLSLLLTLLINLFKR